MTWRPLRFGSFRFPCDSGFAILSFLFLFSVQSVCFIQGRKYDARAVGGKGKGKSSGGGRRMVRGRPAPSCSLRVHA
ncbi:hypothetical protein BZA70DRAFT_274642 [Myxozyma melibiosi]|uniref:Secreted protein n=1 Tax=Myxozyma melibiosi TaxID=54550 RepID=A0ABR1FC23_9ASCO